MPWYAAHAILSFDTDEEPQGGLRAWENVFLIQADTPDQARDKAEGIARRDETHDGSIRVDGRPARLVFGGIRMVVSVLHENPDGPPGDGDEITYSEFLVPDRAALDRLVAGDDVPVTYLGRDAAPDKKA